MTADRFSALRIGLILDSTIALEALIIQRALGLVNPRRQEWLRNLLIKGFCAECAEIRQLRGDFSGPLAERYVPRERAAPKSTATTNEASDSVVDTPNSASNPPPRREAVSMSALKAVIG